MDPVNSCTSNCTRFRLGFFEHDWSNEAPWDILSNYFDYQPWLFSLLGSVMVGLSGVFPLLVIPIDEAADLKHGDGAKTLKILLSFAVGGLLGDVFLHLLPEAWENHSLANKGNSSSGVNHDSMSCGLWVLCGFLVFIIAEKMFSSCQGSDEDEFMNSEEDIAAAENNNYSEIDLKYDLVGNQMTKLNGFKKNQQLNNVKNGLCNVEVTKINGFKKDQQLNGLKSSLINGNITKFTDVQKHEQPNGFKKSTNGTKIAQQLVKNKGAEKHMKEKPRHIAGYLNLIANCVDNFTHGLAVGGSFLVSFRLGALTTFAILIHEIPHEIGDFAILLKSGFNRWDAAKAQLMTATGGICGALIAVIFSGDAVESKTSWILPFTAGGFLHIGLVTVLPELLKETDPWESLKQIGALLTGIVVMAILTIMCD
ncbi:zinc transporter ZIP13 isoform X2 [Phymastichus coffea]|uniref:zinc transporter ZIP13 isoform X2 n=1 Tax=Phymastichus coffea TaxID=108790 RepID=UPI00273A900D|nr:zinc transporter ZIP13 isoform X2 [Phymastichus coffea]